MKLVSALHCITTCYGQQADQMLLKLPECVPFVTHSNSAGDSTVGSRLRNQLFNSVHHIDPVHQSRNGHAIQYSFNPLEASNLPGESVSCFQFQLTLERGVRQEKVKTRLGRF